MQLIGKNKIFEHNFTTSQMLMHFISANNAGKKTEKGNNVPGGICIILWRGTMEDVPYWKQSPDWCKNEIWTCRVRNC